MTDFHAMLRVPFRGTMEGSLTMSHVYSKQPARHSQAHTFAQRLFSAVIRHVRVFIFFFPLFYFRNDFGLLSLWLFFFFLIFYFFSPSLLLNNRMCPAFMHDVILCCCQ